MVSFPLSVGVQVYTRRSGRAQMRRLIIAEAILSISGD